MPRVLPQGDLRPGVSSPDETTQLVNFLRGYCATEYRQRQRVSTTGSGAFTTIWSLDMPGNSAWRVWADFTGRAPGGAGRATYTMAGLFFRGGAASSQQGATSTLLSIESAAAMDASLSASGNGVVAQVRDDGVLAMNWTVLIRIEEI